MVRRIVYRPLALDDLDEIYDWRKASDGPESAMDLIGAIRARCAELAEFPDRGTPRPEIAPGLRSIPFKRRAVIAYLVRPETVAIVGIMYGGRDLAALQKPGRV